MKMKKIVKLAERFARLRSKVSTIVSKINEAQQKAVNSNRDALRKAVNQANEAQHNLGMAIKLNPELFEKPRTINVDGIKLGMTTKVGRVEIVDEDALIQRIQENHPKLVESLIVFKKSIDKDALNKLDDDIITDLLLTRAKDDPHSVLIKPTDSAVDKLVARLLEDPNEATKTEELVA